MKVYALGILSQDDHPPTILGWVENLSDLPQIPSVSKMVQSGIQQICETVVPDQPYRGHYQQKFYVQIYPFYSHSKQIYSVVVTDQDYPLIKSHQLAQLAVEVYSQNEKIEMMLGLQNLLDRSQQPDQIKINQIRADLDELKKILLDDIEALLERNGKLEDLMVSTEQMTFQSKVFRQKARSMNRCCVIL